MFAIKTSKKFIDVQCVMATVSWLVIYTVESK